MSIDFEVNSALTKIAYVCLLMRAVSSTALLSPHSLQSAEAKLVVSVNIRVFSLLDRAESIIDRESSQAVKIGGASLLGFNASLDRYQKV